MGGGFILIDSNAGWRAPQGLAEGCGKFPAGSLEIMFGGPTSADSGDVRLGWSGRRGSPTKSAHFISSGKTGRPAGSQRFTDS